MPDSNSMEVKEGKIGSRGIGDPEGVRHDDRDLRGGNPEPVSAFRLNDVDWVAIGAIATALAALATAILAAATYWLARTTRDELQQTKREITATEKQAEASTKVLAEVQIDRDLNWRPYLVVEKTGLSDAQINTDSISLRNIGRGPAFNCVCARCFYVKIDMSGVPTDFPLWRLATAMSTIEGGLSKEFLLPNRGGADPVPLVLFESPVPGQPNIAIFYQDIVGQRAYRQVPPRAAPDVWAPGKPVDQWVSWYFGHINMPVPTLPASPPS
jgi:hypothetical protein